MDISAGTQGQAENPTLPQNSHKIDNDMNQHDKQGTRKGTKFTVNSETESDMSETPFVGDSKLVIEAPNESVSSWGDNADELLKCFELRTDGCVLQTVRDPDVIDDQKTNEEPDTRPKNEQISGSSGDSLPLNPLSSPSEDSATNNDSTSSSDTSSESQDTDNHSKQEPEPEQKASVSASKVVVNKKTESLRNLMEYESASDSEESDVEVDENKTEQAENKTDTEKSYRVNQEDSSGLSGSESASNTLSSESESDSDNSDGEFNNSDGDSASVIDASDDGILTESPVFDKNRDTGAVKKTNKSMLDLPDFLPPIPDLSQLNINAAEEFMHIGKVNAIISELVTVEAIPGTPAFDLDSMLFMDDQSGKRPLGPIFDVIGPVAAPFYCIRFNNEDEIKKLEIKSGMKVYAAPKSDEFSKFLFVKELLRFKGSDASWLNDEERPDEFADFSDDEKERAARRAKTSTKRKLEDSSLERHKRYEKTMNQCNTLNTRVCKLMDAQKNLSRQIRSAPRENVTTVEPPPPGCLELPDVPPEFDPAIPPPGFGHSSPYGYVPQASLFANSAAVLGQPSGDNSQYGSYGGAHAALGGPAQFGCFYANQTPAPHSLGGSPPVRWQRCDNFRRVRHQQRASHRQNSDNYFTNNGRNVRGAGPSYQPF